MIEAIKTLTAELLNKMGLSFENIEVELIDESYHVNISSKEDSSTLIGWKGNSLSSLQEIIKALVSKHSQEKPYIILDVEHYKKKQEQNILDLARIKAGKVKETGEEALMPPMSPYLRRLVHMFLSETPEFSDLATESTGEGRTRQIKIKLK